jgi:hypothetical protein
MDNASERPTTDNTLPPPCFAGGVYADKKHAFPIATTRKSMLSVRPTQEKACFWQDRHGKKHAYREKH